MSRHDERWPPSVGTTDGGRHQSARSAAAVTSGSWRRVVAARRSCRLKAAGAAIGRHNRRRPPRVGTINGGRHRWIVATCGRCGSIVPTQGGGGRCKSARPMVVATGRHDQRRPSPVDRDDVWSLRVDRADSRRWWPPQVGTINGGRHRSAQPAVAATGRLRVDRADSRRWWPPRRHDRRRPPRVGTTSGGRHESAQPAAATTSRHNRRRPPRVGTTDGGRHESAQPTAAATSRHNRRRPPRSARSTVAATSRHDRRRPTPGATTSV